MGRSVTIDMMVTEPEVCRRILAHRFPGLRTKKKKDGEEERTEERSTRCRAQEAHM